MANLASKKAKFAFRVVDVATRLMEVIRDSDELSAAYTANGFQVGGANALTDLDLETSGEPHLTAAIVTGAMTTIGALSGAATQVHRDNLRRARRDPLDTLE